MDNNQSKTPRKRMCNFTADEKALLAQLIKKTPIVESKLTDGKSVSKKQAAWDLITREFNSNANVHKRETITLKRAWDNMKAYTRKARATERGNLLRTGGGPSAPPPPHNEAIITMVEEAAPIIICELNNPFDSDGTILDTISNSQQQDLLDKPNISVSIDTRDILETENLKDSQVNILSFEEQEDGKIFDNNHFEVEDLQVTDGKPYLAAKTKTADQVRKPTDYIRREAVIRIKHLENKKRMEMQILKTQLEVEEIKKATALLEQQRQKTLLEKAKIELEEIKKSNGG
ncbi:uncharacterized protein LOC135075934 [Ostrinia nubilalis]|uniref:uncharacterized protein LOC135075934 n=1 Tax=Ostrinia nubilalis TaxID=29057 RepID=UPI0030822E08